MFPVDLKKLSLIEYSNLSKKILLFSMSSIIVGLSDLIYFFTLSNIISSPVKKNPSEVSKVVFPLLSKSFNFLLYLAYSVFKTFFLLSFTITSSLKIDIFNFLSISILDD